MRFASNGPSVPSHLLNEQGLGNVIFFCGAGVSMPAGLDSFWQLTDRIITQLDAKSARSALENDLEFDRIFAMLAKDFGREEINRQIYDALGTQRPRTLANHRAILKLSKGAAGTTQLVTTNFDLLFERAARGCEFVVPPGLPSLELNQKIHGVVYLHGRLVEPGSTETPRYVISSPDFGRAYLAEGWATRFVKELRERFTLVFLGYRANDPPMRYLLEGLNDREGVVYDNPIYAFTPENADDGVQVWHDRGVTPIPYIADEKHSALWDTIRCWGDAAEKPEEWTKKVLDLARKGPRKLEPFERGQVVQLVSTKSGANAFASAQPPITSEWLSVFDPSARFGPPRRVRYDDDSEEVDPQDEYGLDDDPSRPSKSENRLYSEGVLDPLSWQIGDTSSVERLRLQGSAQVLGNPLPPRLHALASWFGARCHEPAAVWWSAGWRTLDPHLLWFVARRLRSRHSDGIPEPAAKFWSLYLEMVESHSIDDRDYRWYEFEGMTKEVGWTDATLRFFEDCVKPTVSPKRPFLKGPYAPSGSWDELDLNEVVDFEVSPIKHHKSDFEFPREHLARVVATLRRALIRQVELLNEIEDHFWQPSNLYPSDKPGERYHDEKELFVFWFTNQFKALYEHQREAAYAEFRNWPSDDPRVFAKLRVWAAQIPDFLSVEEKFSLVLDLDEDVFWGAYDQRGLLHLIRSLWPELADKQKRQIELILERGPTQWKNEDEDHFAKRSAAYSASRLRWLELNHCELTKAGRRSLNRLKNVDERWTDDWAASADDSLGPRGGMIAEDAETRGLEELRPVAIIDAASETTEERFDELTYYKPFKGLVAHHPQKALLALRIGLRRNQFPVQFWKDLLSEWPSAAPMRLTWLLARTVASLCDERALELRYYGPNWLQKNLRKLYRQDRPQALEVFDGFLRPYMAASPEFSQSSMGNAIVQGETQRESEVSVNKAINSPVGMLTAALWSVTANKGKPKGKLNGNLARRFDLLSQVPGHGGGHSISTLAMHFGWIEYRYKNWSREFLLPKFALAHPLSEAAWHGLIYNRNPLSPEVFDALRDPLLAILRGEAEWFMSAEHKRILVDSMVILSDPTSEGGPTFSFEEVREVLRTIGDRGRGQALWALGNALERGRSWPKFARPFIKQAWPRELRFKSEEVTRGFLHIVEKTKTDFADAVAVVQPFLRPVPNADMFTYRISKNLEDDKNFAKDFPRETLSLLDAITGDDRVQMPYGLSEALTALAELEPSIRETAEFRRLSALVE